jgi:hypothetical protein
MAAAQILIHKGTTGCLSASAGKHGEIDFSTGGQASGGTRRPQDQPVPATVVQRELSRPEVPPQADANP